MKVNLMHPHYLTQVIPIPPSVGVCTHARTHILAHPLILWHFESDSLHPGNVFILQRHILPQSVANLIKQKLLSYWHQHFLAAEKTQPVGKQPLSFTKPTPEEWSFRVQLLRSYPTTHTQTHTHMLAFFLGPVLSLPPRLIVSVLRGVG